MSLQSDIIERERLMGQNSDLRAVLNHTVGAYLLGMTSSQRKDLFRELLKKYCNGCGKIQIDCDCDEEEPLDHLRERLEKEIDRWKKEAIDLRQWKKEMMTVKQWWDRIQNYMQEENDNVVATSQISDVVLIRMQALDQLLRYIKPHSVFYHTPTSPKE